MEGERRRKAVLLIPVVNSLNRALGTLSCLFINYVIAKGEQKKDGEGIKAKGGQGRVIVFIVSKGEGKVKKNERSSRRWMSGLEEPPTYSCIGSLGSPPSFSGRHSHGSLPGL